MNFAKPSVLSDALKTVAATGLSLPSALETSTTALTPLGRWSGASAASAIAFIDGSVADYQTLVAGVAPGTEVYILNSSQDAVTQITNTLLGRHDISSLHIVSHGEAGGLNFGAGKLNLSDLPQYAAQVQSWGKALTDDADILLYGCNVAQGELGKAFTSILSQLTGADVAASDDLTGSSVLGGDWELEVNTGSIEAGLVFQTATQAAYQSVLLTTIDTQANWDGTAALSSFGETNTATYGQTFTVPTNGENRLTSFTLYLNDNRNPDAIDFSAYVMAWNGSSATGAVLYQSSVVSTLGTPSMEAYTFNVGALNLNPGAQYVAFLSASQAFDGIVGTGRMGLTGDTYSGGNAVYLNNGSNFAALTSSAWTIRSTNDFATLMTFTNGVNTPGNDNFFNRLKLPGAPTAAIADNIGATSEGGGDPSGNAVWWSWTAPTSGSIAIDTIGSNFDTFLGVFTGSDVNSLTPIINDNDSGGGGTSRVTFNATAGTTYSGLRSDRGH